MTQDEIVQRVATSRRSDWDSLHPPLYVNTEPEEHRGHHSQAAFKPDIAIGLRWGHEVIRGFVEPWIADAAFADQTAHSAYLDITYNGEPVFRTVYVTVDGGRAYLPLPDLDSGQLTVPQLEHDLVRLLDSLVHREFDRYFGQAGFVIAN